jgi:hypothetical protein
MAACGLLLTLGLAAPAGAAVKTAAQAGAAATTAAATAPTCLTGEANSYEWYTYCKGTSPASFRVVAACADFQGVVGAEYTDSTGNISYANCAATGGLGSTLAMGTTAEYGIVLCSKTGGTGAYEGYIDRKGDISTILYNWGGGAMDPSTAIANGGTLMCDWSDSVPAIINLSAPPT